MASSQATQCCTPRGAKTMTVASNVAKGHQAMQAKQQHSFAHNPRSNAGSRRVSDAGCATKRCVKSSFSSVPLGLQSQRHSLVGDTGRLPGNRTVFLQRRVKRHRPTSCWAQPDAPLSGCQQHSKGSLDLEEPQPQGIIQQATKKLVAALLAAALTLQAQPLFAQGLPCEDPGTYYAPIAGLRGPALKSKLHDILKDAKSFSYVQVWEALKILDATDAANPAASLDVNDIYSTRTFPKSTQGLPEGWNREHLWPRSYGLLEGKPEFTDLHNLRPADTNVNSARGNKPFGECDRGNDATCLVPANREAGNDTATNREIWTPPGQVRGDIARALLYMAVRYEGEMPGTKDLELSDDPSVGAARMGRLSTILKWHAIDPPSPAERLRNDRVCALYQRNRNPFVDRPELVAAIWGAGKESPSFSSTTVEPQPAPAVPKSGPSPPPVASTVSGDPRNTAWVNEFHYNNTGKDEGEFVEIALGANVDPSTAVVYLYNGANGQAYRTLPVGNVTLFQKGDVTSDGATLYVCQLADGLQNGPADGIAITLGGRVVEFISYEGSLTATSGPAAGLTASPIGVAESEKTPKGSSVGLVDFGKKLWEVFARATPGFKNR